MIRLFDYSCTSCGITQEEYITSAITPEFLVCNSCGGNSKRIFSFGKVNSQSVDAPWIKLTAKMADPKSTKPHIKEFIRHPTRANLNTYLKKENLRIGDKAEPNFPVIDHSDRDKKLKKDMIRLHQELYAVWVGRI